MQTFRPKRNVKRTPKQQKWDKMIAGGTPMFANAPKRDKRATGRKGDGEVMRRCQIAVYKRDTYRRTGRGRTGFEMHYNREQCSRPAVDGRDCCWQHAKQIDEGWNLGRANYHEFMRESPAL